MLHEEVDVLKSLAKGRDVQRHDAQAIVEVLAELLPGHHCRERLLRRGDNVYPHRLLSAHALEAAFLEHPHQLDLQPQGDIVHVVEKERPAVGEFEAADPLLRSPGEGPRLVPEQFRFDQVPRERGTRQRDERSCRSM